jgi:hypothetical protein
MPVAWEEKLCMDKGWEVNNMCSCSILRLGATMLRSRRIKPRSDLLRCNDTDNFLYVVPL